MTAIITQETAPLPSFGWTTPDSCSDCFGNHGSGGRFCDCSCHRMAAAAARNPLRHLAFRPRRVLAALVLAAVTVLPVSACQNDTVCPPAPPTFGPCPSGEHFGIVKADQWGCVRDGRTG